MRIRPTKVNRRPVALPEYPSLAWLGCFEEMSLKSGSRRDARENQKWRAEWNSFLPSLADAPIDPANVNPLDNRGPSS
jgi:hypothetical protein